MSSSVTSVSFTATGSISLGWLTGWSLTETGGTNPIVVTIRRDDGSGATLFTLEIDAGESVGEDLAAPLGGYTALHVTVAGTGTCAGALRGRIR